MEKYNRLENFILNVKDNYFFILVVRVFIKILKFFANYKRYFVILSFALLALLLIFLVFGILAYYEDSHARSLYYKADVFSKKYFQGKEDKLLLGININDKNVADIINKYRNVINYSDLTDISYLAMYNLGLLYYSAKEYDLAFKYFNKLRNINFTFSDLAHLKIGDCFLALSYLQKNIQKSIENLSEAYKIYSSFETLFSNSGKLAIALESKAFSNFLIAKKYLTIKDYKQALLFYKKSKSEYQNYIQFIKSNPNEFSLTDSYITYISKGQYVDKINIYIRKIDIHIEYINKKIN